MQVTSLPPADVGHCNSCLVQTRDLSTLKQLDHHQAGTHDLFRGMKLWQKAWNKPWPISLQRFSTCCRPAPLQFRVSCVARNSMNDSCAPRLPTKPPPNPGIQQPKANDLPAPMLPWLLRASCSRERGSSSPSLCLSSPTATSSLPSGLHSLTTSSSPLKGQRYERFR